jgi:dTDP-4-amino-4,6-dideoxygalactose transaminase
VADIHPETFAVDAESLAAVITPSTRVVIPVHPFGLCADMDPISAICRARGIAVLEDAACALGSGYHERLAGSLGDLACFSFHPRKIITTGEGGMITTADGDVAERLRLLSTHGGRPGELFPHFEVPGFNYRMSDIQAAIGVVQLGRLADILAGRRRAAAVYSEVLSAIEGVRPPVEPAGYRHTYQSYVVMTDPRIDRDQTIRAMRERGVECTLGTYSVSRQAAYQGRVMSGGEKPVASWEAYERSITLPLFPQMTVEDVRLVAVTLGESLAWR